jgi:hypothetical protein
MIGKCQKCGDRFERDAGETWKKLCLDCWKDSKAKQESGAENLLRAQLSALRERLYRAEVRAQQLEQRGQFDADELKTLRRLCHPDRHGNSEASNRLTQKINNLLRQ